ncbi:MAG: hypothetical protein A3K59_06145 [Euryarchaeota archaeon RBG_19FT_COMBO_69_17]|nr:MAG: hypothetical protein A3K59_06145 [Euryarchaeota archaeon RBG_19FT_COMBO_69_17]
MAEAVPQSFRRPLLALILLSPVIAEMLSGSAPPVEWLLPTTPLLLIWLYGSGVLVMRETAVRWNLGWAGILVLGAAYGIIEEGLAVKSFFDPAWMDLGTLAWYGRWLDTNWVWAIWLTMYHAIISIAVPIFLVDTIWPQTRGRRLTSDRGYAVAVLILAAATGFMFLFLTSYVPSAAHVLAAVLAVAFLVWFAKTHADRLWLKLPAGAPPRPAAYAVAGFSFFGGSFLLYAGGPYLGGHPAVTFLEGGLVLLGAMLLLRRTTGDPTWARHRYAFVGGTTGFLIALAFFLEAAGWTGMAVVGAAFAILLIRIPRRLLPEVRAESGTHRPADR